MAITRKIDNSLVDTNLVTDSKIQPLDEKNTEKKVAKTAPKSKKPNFISTTIEELRLVEWPNLAYIWRWASVIIIFTFFLSIFMGGLDHILANSIKFVDCSSPQSGKRTVGECVGEFAKNITGQK
jgi:preprotein translocase SecE subunit